MQSVTLICHPLTPTEHVQSLTAQVALQGRDAMLVRFRLDADVERVRIPPPVEVARTDELWRHTCFEAFVRPALQTRYCEFNFAPSGEWAAYVFNDYRRGMRNITTTSPPTVRCTPRVTGIELEVQANLRNVPGLQNAQMLRLALSAVIEDDEGRLSYWALAHPTAQPDFHHPGSFTFEVSRGGLIRT